MKPLPQLPDDCIRSILQIACEHALEAEKCYSVLYSVDADIDRSGGLRGRKLCIGPQCLGKHRAIVRRRWTWVLHTDKNDGSLDTYLIACDCLARRNALLTPSDELLVADGIGDVCEEWGTERLRDAVEDMELLPCIAWGKRREVNYSIRLSHAVSARVALSVLQVPTCTIRTAACEMQWGVSFCRDLSGPLVDYVASPVGDIVGYTQEREQNYSDDGLEA